MVKRMAGTERRVDHRHGKPRRWDVVLQQSDTDMIEGGMFKSILWSSIPLLTGGFFQQFYNTVNSYVVGNFVNTNALTTMGASTPVVNMLVRFFMGLSAGADVVISQYLGGKQKKEMGRTVHSSVALAALLSVVFTGAGVALTKLLLQAIGVPEEVLPHSSLYLLIYFGGIIFSLFCNMGAGILRAVGDSKHPLIYLTVASLVNTALDFLFVCGFHMGIAGVAIATIIAQAVSSAMVLCKLMYTQENYRIELRKVCFHKKMVRWIVSLGFPAALQQSITSFSNVVVQSYIDFFGAAAMAEYSAMLKIDRFLQLPLRNFNMAIITFVGQNIGTRKYKRVKKGIWAAWVMCSLIILMSSVCIYFFASFLISTFMDDAQVIASGSGILRIFSTAYIILLVIQILNGTLRRTGLSKILAFFMLGCFVVLRQIYLMIAVPMTHSMFVVLTGWPVTWVIYAIGVSIYYVRVDWLPKEAEEQGR